MPKNLELPANPQFDHTFVKQATVANAGPHGYIYALLDLANHEMPGKLELAEIEPKE